MAKEDFISGLIALGYNVVESEGKVQFEYTVNVGRYSGEKLMMGFQGIDGFPTNPPGGPHLDRKLLAAGTPGTHDSTVFPDWQYWSRPYHKWGEAQKSVKTYMAHINFLFHHLLP
jgi:hypothetical protein